MPVFYSEKSPVPARVQSLSTATSLAINTSIYDAIELTALASACEFTLTGNPINLQRLTLIIKDSGGPHNLTFTGAWDSQNTPLPTTTGAAGRKTILEFIYSSSVSKWLCVSYLTAASAPKTALTKRVQSAGTLSNPFTPNIDSYDTIYFTGCADGTVINAPSGTPYDGQTLSFIGYVPLTRYLAFNAIYVSGAGLVQSEYLANKYCTVTFQYISAVNKWIQIYRGQGA